MHKVDWDDVRYFLAVYRSGSSNGAARQLRVQHTTVGRRLASLEAKLGARLFIRTPMGLSPTDAAAAIAPHAEEAERCFIAIERQVSRSDGRIEGKVRLATSEAFGGYIIRHLATLQARYPALTVEIDTSNAVVDLARGGADIAVRMVATTQPDLISRRVGSAGWSLFASADYIARRGMPSSPFELHGHEVIGFGDSLAETPGARWLGAHGKDAHVPLRGQSLVAVVNAAAAGIGLAMAPCFLAAAEPNLRRVTPQMLSSREIWLVYHPDAGRLVRVRTVIDFIAETIGADGAFLSGA
jgi:DNA-binding transcriptional LysR family regulator